MQLYQIRSYIAEKIVSCISVREIGILLLVSTIWKLLFLMGQSDNRKQFLVETTGCPFKVLDCSLNLYVFLCNHFLERFDLSETTHSILLRASLLLKPMALMSLLHKLLPVLSVYSLK